MTRILFQPSGRSVLLDEDESLFAAARRLGLPIATACGGHGTCGLCRIRILVGEATLPPPNLVEKRHLGNVFHLTHERLACQLRPQTDAEILLPERHARMPPA